MRLKLHQLERHQHDDIVTGLDWTASNELLSVSDDRRLLRWPIDGSSATELMQAIEPHVTDLHCQAQANPMVALAQSNGQFLIASAASGKIEVTSARQHQGSIACIRWSFDGSALLTSGEDGRLLQWSRSGHLRSKLVAIDHAIYCCSWSPDNQAVLYANGSTLIVRPLRVDDRATQWRTPCGLIVALDWSPVNELIICGGEGCRFSIYDADGQLMFALPKPMPSPITSLKWAPNGRMFAVGSLDLILLCDQSGWAYARHPTQTGGSVLALAWTKDGTHLAGAGVNGAVLFGQVIDRDKQWRQFEATLNDRNQIVVSNVLVDLAGKAFEVLDFADRVIDFALGFGFLVVTTSKQVYCYHLETFAAPSLVDIKSGATAHLIVLSAKFFVLVGNALMGIRVWSYEAREICSARIASLQTDLLTQASIAASPDTLAIIDRAQAFRSILFLDALSATPICRPLSTSERVVAIALSQHGLVSDRKIALIDARADLWIKLVHSDQGPIKLASMATCVQFHTDTDALAAITDGQLRLWHYANAAFVDRTLIEATTESFAEGLGRNCTIHEFSGNRCAVRRQDGTLISVAMMPYPSLLFALTTQGQWTAALKLARFVDESVVWACLATMAIHGRELDIAEHSFAAIDCVDKLYFIQRVKALPGKAVRDAELALFRRRPAEAEQILLGQKLYYRAIKLNLGLYQWLRALELARKYHTHLDTVVAYRQRYLRRYHQEETLQEFVAVGSSLKIDWSVIEQNEAREANLEASTKLSVA